MERSARPVIRGFVSTGRLEAFSDGVFAIAATLLVLDLRTPVAGQSFGAALTRQWPSYVAYVVSFLVIGIMWINHHAVITLAARADRVLLFLNIGLLMTIAAIPFPTELVAEGLVRGGRDAKLAAFVYSLLMFAAAIAFTAIALWITSDASGLLRPHLVAPPRGELLRGFGIGSFCYLGLVGLSFVSPLITLLGHGVLAVYYCFDQLRTRVVDSPGG